MSGKLVRFLLLDAVQMYTATHKLFLSTGELYLMAEIATRASPQAPRLEIVSPVMRLESRVVP